MKRSGHLVLKPINQHATCISSEPFKTVFRKQIKQLLPPRAKIG